MPTHVALLRGVNNLGSKNVAMAELKDVVISLGHTDVTTYIQSGNVLFTPRPGAATLAADLERAIADRIGMTARAVVLSRDELAGCTTARSWSAARSTCTLRTDIRRASCAACSPEWAGRPHQPWPERHATGRRSASWWRSADRESYEPMITANQI